MSKLVRAIGRGRDELPGRSQSIEPGAHISNAFRFCDFEGCYIFAAAQKFDVQNRDEIWAYVLLNSHYETH